MASLRFSERALLSALTIALSVGGCVTVKPHEKELLAEPAMVYGSGGAATRQEAHVLDNREGSMATSASGGGCGCN